jgi:hypothetical protein
MARAGKVLVLLLSVQSAANFAYCCCGFSCESPNASFSREDAPDPCHAPCCGEESSDPESPRACLHVGPGAKIIDPTPADWSPGVLTLQAPVVPQEATGGNSPTRGTREPDRLRTCAELSVFRL